MSEAVAAPGFLSELSAQAMLKNWAASNMLAATNVAVNCFMRVIVLS
jgi:hypothetical protein